MLIELIGISVALIIIILLTKKIHRLYRIIKIQRILRKVFRDDR
jgi:hypothetical protein